MDRLEPRLALRVAVGVRVTRGQARLRGGLFARWRRMVAVRHPLRAVGGEVEEPVHEESREREEGDEVEEVSHPRIESRLFHVQRAALTEERDCEGESDRGLARGDRDDEHGEDLPGQVREPAGERDQVQVDGVQHELDRHEDREEVAPHEHAEEADREEEERDNQVVVDRDVHGAV